KAAGAAQPPSVARTGPAPPGRPVCAPAAMAFSFYRRPSRNSVGKEHCMWLPSPWRFVTSESAEFGVGIGKTGVATTKMSFFVINDDDPDQLMHELLFVGLGGGVGIGLPVSGSYASANWPSEGYRIFRGPRAPPTLDAEDFGGPAQVVTASAGF